MSGVEKVNIFSTTIRICITTASSVAYGSYSSKTASFKITAFAFFLYLLTPIDFISFIAQSNHLNISPPVCIITFTRTKY
jgi:hypothetical protein